MSRCITCQKPVNRNKAQMKIELKDKSYLTCCPLCQSELEENPEKYMHQLEGKHLKH